VLLIEKGMPYKFDVVVIQLDHVPQYI